MVSLARVVVQLGQLSAKSLASLDSLGPHGSFGARFTRTVQGWMVLHSDLLSSLCMCMS